MVLRHFSSLLCCLPLEILLLWGTFWQAQPWACAEVQSIPCQIFKEKRAWKGNEHIIPSSSWQGIQSRVAWGRLKALPLSLVCGGFIFPCCRCCCSCYWESTSRAERKLMDGQTDKEETVRSQVCAALCKHHSHKPCKMTQVSHPLILQELPLLWRRHQRGTAFRFPGSARIHLHFRLLSSLQSVPTQNSAEPYPFLLS